VSRVCLQFSSFFFKFRSACSSFRLRNKKLLRNFFKSVCDRLLIPRDLYTRKYCQIKGSKAVAAAAPLNTHNVRRPPWCATRCSCKPKCKPPQLKESHRPNIRLAACKIGIPRGESRGPPACPGAAGRSASFGIAEPLSNALVCVCFLHPAGGAQRADRLWSLRLPLRDSLICPFAYSPIHCMRPFNYSSCRLRPKIDFILGESGFITDRAVSEKFSREPCMGMESQFWE